MLKEKVRYRIRVVVAIVVQSLSHVQLFVTSWTIALQTSLSMGFSMQEYWNGFPCPPPGDLPDPGIESASLMPLKFTARDIPPTH